MRELPQQDHCDLGLIDDDATEDLRLIPTPGLAEIRKSRTALDDPGVGAPARTVHTHSPAEKKG